MTGTIYEIPLSGDPQSLFIVLAGIEYKLTFIFRDVDQGGWIMDIATTTGAPIVAGIPLVTGADLLAQYAYLGLNVEMRVTTDSNMDAVPTFDNLGSASHLYFRATNV